MPAYKSRVLSLAVAAFVSIPSAHAAPTWVFGELLGSGGTVAGDPVAVRAIFEAALVDIGRAGFESPLLPGNTAPNLAFTGSSFEGSMAAASTGCCAISASTTVGRFNTTAGGGSQWWDARDTSSLTLNSSTSAFGFYATDLGDFGAQLFIDLFAGASDATATSSYVVPHSKSTTASHSDPTQIQGSVGSRSLIFAGFTDTITAYEKIVLRIEQVNGNPDFLDRFGFDDFTVGTLRQVTPPPSGVPEPGTLALVGLSLVALSTLRRRRG